MSGSELYLVIRYKEKFRLQMSDVDAYWHWAICRCRYGVVIPRECTRGRAMELIRECGLVKAHRDENGTIYDTPTHDFRRRYGGKVSITEVRKY